MELWVRGSPRRGLRPPDAVVGDVIAADVDTVTADAAAHELRGGLAVAGRPLGVRGRGEEDGGEGQEDEKGGPHGVPGAARRGGVITIRTAPPAGARRVCTVGT